MNSTSQRFSYRQTGAFSKLVLDYLDAAAALQPFYTHRPDKAGMQAALQERSSFKTNRKVLVDTLKQQYANVPASATVQQQIDSLLKEQTFTITTAHQPNLFTGPLYFIYKILHAIKLAEDYNQAFPHHHFVPVYYMGSEDADFEELSHCTINGTKYQWTTDQTGAFGRMVIDKQVTQLIHELSGQLLVLPYGQEIVTALLDCYQEKRTIQEATFAFVHYLFESRGLIVLIADAKALKELMVPVFEDELLHHRSAQLVEQTTSALEKNYKVQAGGREINLFYFDEDLRERIEEKDGLYTVANTTIQFTKEAMLQELKTNPERFSPNVILRGLYQETILPNIAFIGGGGELAYWLELKKVFEQYQVPYPVLVLRNSFLLSSSEWKTKINQLELSVADFFTPEAEILNQFVKKAAGKKIELNGAFEKAADLYAALKEQATAVDKTLSQHVDALQTKALYRLKELEKKLLKAEKRKFAEQQQQISRIKQQLFPGNSLQERKESFLGFYAAYGKDLIDVIYQASLTLEQEFVVITIEAK